MSTLVIDSTAGVWPRLKAIFEERGLPDIVLAKTAAEAHALLDKLAGNASNLEALSLIVIDSRLDDGDGFELCRKIRKLAVAEHAYIILLVSSAENKLAIEKAKHSGADDYAVKPYDSSEFIRHLLLYARRRTAMLVEDDPVVIKLVSAILRKKQLQLIAATDGMQAYNLINAIEPPRLVILDIGLPGMSGIKLIQHIRSKSSWRMTPVLMLTGSKDANDVKGSLAAGANEYIVKPFQIADFDMRLDKYLADVK